MTNLTQKGVFAIKRHALQNAQFSMVAQRLRTSVRNEKQEKRKEENEEEAAEE